MNRLLLNLMIPALAALAAPAVAQLDRRAAPEPQVTLTQDDDFVKISVSPDHRGAGFLLLLGGFTGETHSLGLGLPEVLRWHQVMAIQPYPSNDHIVMAERRPPIDVLLQAVLVQFDPEFRMTASPVMLLKGTRAGASDGGGS